ncbi:putative sulfate/molybdate transporter [Ostreiculturibacter nitratireducens]|uniref:putative sulfate/molybdate transporter n=1 Tax=Ostreiculturibacter nitratireducens TaxID=3075226 RepID=UPI0031B57E43
MSHGTTRAASVADRARSLTGEISGAFGDLGTFLPYVIAVLVAGVFAPTPLFLGFAAGYLLVALVYRLPIAVQPMKALGAMIVAGALSAEGAAWAGAIIGATLLILAATPRLDRAARSIPQSVVTGLQAGLGLVLGAVALNMMRSDWTLALPAAAILGLSLVWRRGPWALLVVFGALLLVPASQPPDLAVAGSADAALVPAVLSGIMSQLPLTLLNAVVVAAAVARSLFPQDARRVSERRLAATSGLINLALVPLGAMPMCHGAGGIAAHHRFGARGSVAPLVMALFCVAAAATGPGIVKVLAAIPLPVVGALLAHAAADLLLTRRMFDARPDCRPVIGATMIATYFLGALFGLVAGLAAESLRAHIVRKRHSTSSGAGR